MTVAMTREKNPIILSSDGVHENDNKNTVFPYVCAFEVFKTCSDQDSKMIEFFSRANAKWLNGPAAESCTMYASTSKMKKIQRHLGFEGG